MEDELSSASAARPKRSRVLVVEDNAFVRASAVALINCAAGLECCGEADAIAGTALLVARLCPDLVLLDLQLRDGDATGLIACLKKEFPSLPVLVFSLLGSPSRVRNSLQAGARGYLLKEDAPDELTEAIHALLQGRLYVSRSLAPYLLEEPPPAESCDPTPLPCGHATEVHWPGR